MIIKVKTVQLKKGYTKIYFKTLKDMIEFYNNYVNYGTDLKFESYPLVSDGIHVYGFDASFVYIAPCEEVN